MARKTVAIVGAGMAGLACADRLAQAGIDVRLFDKARKPGGRLATRAVDLPDGRTVCFDHGAQYVTANDPGFVDRLSRLERAGVVTPYPWFIFHQSRGGLDIEADETRFVGAEGMACVPGIMARAHSVTGNRQVSGVSKAGGAWRITFTDGPSEGGFDGVVVAVPAEQAAPLIGESAPDFAAEALAARTAPCWAGLFVFEGGGEPAFGAVRIEDDGPLAWLARTADGQGWIAHATAEWSRANLDLSAEAAALSLEVAVRGLLPDIGPTLFMQAHRWRFALVETTAPSPFAWDPTLKLGLCGDWRLGSRAECAWLSGDSLGRAIAAACAPTRPKAG